MQMEVNPSLLINLSRDLESGFLAWYREVRQAYKWRFPTGIGMSLTIGWLPYSVFRAPVFAVPQNTPYTKEACFGEAYSVTLPVLRPRGHKDEIPHPWFHSSNCREQEIQQAQKNYSFHLPLQSLPSQRASHAGKMLPESGFLFMEPKNELQEHEGNKQAKSLWQEIK